MRKIVWLFLVFFIIAPKSIIAQEQDLIKYQQDFQKTYRYYQSLVDGYNLTKNKYLTYQTVSSQAEYQESAKKLLLSEVEPLYSYANILKIKLAEATNILWYKENLLYLKLDDEISYLYYAKNDIEKLSTITDTFSFWEKFHQRYLTVSEIGYNVLAIRKIGYINKIVTNLKATKEKADLFVSQILINTPEKKAAIERLSNLKNQINSIDNNLSYLDQTQKAINKENFYQSAGKIDNYINEISQKSNEVLNEINNVLFTLN